jgi:bacterioferritin
LSEALKAELTAINQYFLHGKMCDNWGYFRLGPITAKNPSKKWFTRKN